ncbi:YqxA family protein [Lederbergia sp. NSJ-179]|uniref:DUF3679 domain-containing protein n=1 Tax=Lederbergia sp. NSJ-179 TaxID=2931402 RepID=UPI001FD30221|nr:DUF3679 domain-containing protein [Lederbergia sp. NSJ-179]MCJ7841819.1 YqxA family protein [Lederbergia sp. NSJ-179]
MGKFVMKSLLLSLVLVAGVVIGLNKANQGMNEMKGYTDSSFTTPVDVKKTEDGKINAAVLGNELSSFNLDEKKEKLEDAKAFNFFSEAGKLLANMVSSIAQAVINFFASLF